MTNNEFVCAKLDEPDDISVIAQHEMIMMLCQGTTIYR